MRLKKLRLAGFKSFVDPVTLSFASPFTAIVGPNGCGKSNVVDAIRWVTGERQARQLRGASLEDVIFNGSAGRKPVGRAMVELVFDNDAHDAVPAYARFGELSIRRELDRAGNSHYRLNGKRCRRRDIMDLLMGTGLGPASYAVIEQGMVGRIIDASPEQLRCFVEENAGISRYKERRKETTAKLYQAHQDMQRLNDVCYERVQLRDRLRQQAEQARQHQRLQHEVEALQHSIQQGQWQRLWQQLQDSRQQHSRLTQQLHSMAATLEQARQQQAQYQAQQQQAEADEQQQQQALHALRGRCQAMQARQQEQQRALQVWQTQQAQNQQQQQQLEARIEQVVQQRQQQAKQQHQLTAELDSLCAQQTAENAHLRTLEAAVESQQTAWQQAQQQLLQVQQKNQHDHILLQQAERDIAQAKTRLDELQASRPAPFDEALLPPLEQAVVQMQQHIAQLADQNKGLDTALHAAEMHDQEQRRLLREQQQACQQAVYRHTECQARVAALTPAGQSALEDWLRTRQGVFQGRIRQRLQVPEAWEPAVEWQLGGWLHACLHPDPDAWLREETEPLPAGFRIWRYPAPVVVLKAPVKGWQALHEVLGLDAGWQALFAGIWVVDDWQQARSQQHLLAARHSILSACGKRLTAHGMACQMTDQQSPGVLPLSRQLRLAAHNKQQQQQQLHRLQNAVQQAEQQRHDAQHAMQEGKQALYEAHMQLQQRQQRQNKLRLQQQQAEQQQQHWQQQCQQFHLQSEQAEQTRAELAPRCRAGRARMEQQQQNGSSLHDTLQQTRQELARQQQQSRQRQQQREACQERLQTHRVQDARRQQQEEQDRAYQQSLKKVERSLQQQAEKLQAQPADKDALASLLQAEQVAVQACQAVQKKRQEVVAKAQQQEKDIHRQQQQQSRQQERHMLLQQRMQDQQQRMQEQAEEMDPTLCQPGEPPAEATINRMRRQLKSTQAQLAQQPAVNLAALDDCAQVEDELAVLTAQMEDVRRSRLLLEQAISTIDEQCSTRFNDSFVSLQQHFQALFQRLMGGGSAELLLTEKNLLATGVEIKASPPGKRMRRLQLLSGGEKTMTAIALVFALFQRTRAPFCVLDEVDAPLDDHNLRRYLELLREWSQDIPLILISHKRPSMECADQLIGITMAEAGVSRTVLVDLAQWPDQGEVD